MRKLFLCLFVLLAISVVSARAQGLKIGVVDADKVIQNSAEGKSFFAKLQDFYDSKRKEIEPMVNAIQNKHKDIQAREPRMSEDQKRQAQMELQKMQTDLKRAQEDAQREGSLKLNSGLEKFQRELAPIIRQVALEKGLDLVLNRGSNSNIVFISERLDITDDITEKYDAM